MSVEQIDFGPDQLSNFVPKTDEAFEFVDESEDLWVTSYAERQFAPVSVYDEHQEALFIHGIETIDTAIDDVNNDKDFSYRSEYAEELVKLRSELCMRKVCFEMKRGRADIAVLLTSQVTDYQDKLTLLDEAINSDNDAALGVVLALGDLRLEAENEPNLRNLTDYLMLELRHGMNLFANSRAIATLLQDKNIKVDSGRESGYVERVKNEMITLLYGQARTMIARGECAHALELAAADNALLAKVNIYLSTLDEYDKQSVVAISERQKRKIVKSIESELELLEDWRTKHKTAGRIIKQYLHNPETVNTKFLHIIYEHFRGLSSFGYRTEDGTAAEKADALVWLIENKLGYKPKTVTRPVATRQKREDNYAMQINNGIVILPPRNENRDVEPNIVSLFNRAANLTLGDEIGERPDFSPLQQLQAELDIIEVEMAKDSLVTMRDAVDQSRHRQKYNQELAHSFSQVSTIPFMSDSLRIAARIADIQRSHDISADSTYEEQRDNLEKIADVCKTNQIARLSISDDEILAILERHEIADELASK